MTTLQRSGAQADVTEVAPIQDRSDLIEPSEDGTGTTARRWWPALVCAAGYVALVVAVFGPGNPFDATQMTGPRGADEIIQVWWLDWAEYALAHGHNLLFSNWLNAPVGMNAGVNASMPALGVLASPLTALFGPIVTWNVLLRVALFVSALSMCLVLRRWTTWWPAAFVGGLLYGFSVYETGMVSSDLFLTFVPLPPLFFLLLHEGLVRQRWRPVVVGAGIAVVCTVEFLIFSEIFASMVLLGAVATLFYLVANRKAIAEKLPYLKRAAVTVVVVGGVLLVVPVGFTLLGPQHIPGAPDPPQLLAQLHGDLLGPVVPGFWERFSTAGIRNYSARFTHSFIMYLGPPLLLVAISTVVVLRKRGIVLMAGAMAAVSLVLSLGSFLYVGSNDTHIPLPFIVLAHLPLVDGLLSVRFALFTALFTAALVAFGLDALYHYLRASHRPGRRATYWRKTVAVVAPLAVAVIVAVPLVPPVREVSSATAASPFFASASAARNIPPGGIVLTYPYSSAPVFPGALGYSFSPTYQDVNAALLNQAVAGMPFKIVGSYGWRPSGGTNGTAGPSRLKPTAVHALFDLAFYGAVTEPHQMSDLTTANLGADTRTFLERHHVDAVVVLPVGKYPDMARRAVTAAIGPPQQVDGASVWYDVPGRLARQAGAATHVSILVPPETRVVVPARNSRISGPQYVFASASDLGLVSGITKVEFRINGPGGTQTLPSVKTVIGWMGGWNTKLVPNGSYTLTSIATGFGGVTTSAPVPVTVNN